MFNRVFLKNIFSNSYRWVYWQIYFVCILQRVGKELLQMPLQLLHHRHNNFIGIFQRVGKGLLQILLQITDGIIPLVYFSG
jgi:hypothetical protein